MSSWIGSCGLRVDLDNLIISHQNQLGFRARLPDQHHRIASGGWRWRQINDFLCSRQRVLRANASMIPQLLATGVQKTRTRTVATRGRLGEPSAHLVLNEARW